MKVYTSYFYTIRFFKPWQVPLSTACYDPYWFHAFEGPSHKFIDKRGVINGLRAEQLHPDSTCHSLCHGHETCLSVPESCEFLKAYAAQLSKLDMPAFLAKLTNLEKKVQKLLKTSHEIEFILIVHEKPSQHCSERAALQAAFHCQELEVQKPSA